MSERRMRLTYVETSDGRLLVSPSPRTPIPVWAIEESAQNQEAAGASSSETPPRRADRELGGDSHPAGLSDTGESAGPFTIGQAPISHLPDGTPPYSPGLFGGAFYFSENDDYESSVRSHPPGPSSAHNTSPSPDLPLLTRSASTISTAGTTSNQLHRCPRRRLLAASPSLSQQSTTAADTHVEGSSGSDRHTRPQPGELRLDLSSPSPHSRASHDTEPGQEELTLSPATALPRDLVRQHPALLASIPPPDTTVHSSETGFAEVSLAVLLSYTINGFRAGGIPDSIQVYDNDDGLPVWIRTDHIRQIWAFGQPELALRSSLQVSLDDRTYTWLPSIHLAREVPPPSQLEATSVPSPEHSSPPPPRSPRSPAPPALKKSARKTVTFLRQNCPFTIPQRSSSLRSRREVSSPDAVASLARSRREGTLHNIIESDEGHIVMEDHTSAPPSGSIRPAATASRNRGSPPQARPQEAGPPYPPRSSSVGTPLYNPAVTSVYSPSALLLSPRAPERLLRDRSATADSSDEDSESGDAHVIDSDVDEDALTEEAAVVGSAEIVSYKKARAQQITIGQSPRVPLPASTLERTPTRASPVRIIASESEHRFGHRLEDWPLTETSREKFLWLYSQAHGFTRFMPQTINSFQDLEAALRRRYSETKEARVFTLWTATGTWIGPSQIKPFLAQRAKMTYRFDSSTTVIVFTHGAPLGAWLVALTMPIEALRSYIYKTYAARLVQVPASVSEMLMMGANVNSWLDDGKVISDYTTDVGGILKIDLYKILDSMKDGEGKNRKKASAGGPSSVAVSKPYAGRAVKDDYEFWSSSRQIDDFGHLCSFDKVFKTTITDLEGKLVRYIPKDLNFSYRQAALWIEEFETVNMTITFRLQPGVVASESQNMHCLISHMSSKTVVADLIHAVCMFLNELDHKMNPPSTDADAVQISLSLGEIRLFNPKSVWDYFNRKAEHLHIDVWVRRKAEDLWEDPGTFDRTPLHPKLVGAHFEPRTKDELPDIRQLEPELFRWVYAGRLPADKPFWQYSPSRRVMLKVFAGRDWKRVWDPRRDGHANQATVGLFDMGNVEAGMKTMALRKLLWGMLKGTDRANRVWKDWAEFPPAPESLLMYAFSNLHPISMAASATLQQACGVPAWNNVVIVLRPLNRPRVYLRQIPLELDIIPEPWMETEPEAGAGADKTAFRYKMRELLKLGKGRKQLTLRENDTPGPGPPGPGPSSLKADQNSTKGNEKKRLLGFFKRAKEKLTVSDEPSELIEDKLAALGLWKK